MKESSYGGWGRGEGGAVTRKSMVSKCKFCYSGLSRCLLHWWIFCDLVILHFLVQRRRHLTNLYKDTFYGGFLINVNFPLLKGNFYPVSGASSMSVISQNNPNTREACIGVAYSATIHSSGRTCKVLFFPSFSRKKKQKQYQCYGTYFTF